MAMFRDITPVIEPSPDVCRHCHKHREHITPKTKCLWDPGPHEYHPGKAKKQEAKQDKQLCASCGLHPKNPVYTTNGCSHQPKQSED